MQLDVIEHLKQRGLTTMAAQRWSRFISVALDLLDEAADTLAQADAWQLLLKKVANRDPEEPDVTTELYACMQLLQEQSDLSSARRDVHVKCEDPVISTNRSGKRSKAADFVLSTLRHQNALRLVIEAKLLRHSSDIGSAYLGKDGLGCFTTTDSPYTRDAVAGMVAYVRDRSEAEWAAELHDAFGFATPPGVITGRGTVQVVAGRPAHVYCDVDRMALGLASLLLLHRILVFP
jgi:hypothetical protein